MKAMKVCQEIIKLPTLMYDEHGQRKPYVSSLLDSLTHLYTLVREHKKEITFERLLRTIKTEPKLVNSWFWYSSDQRGESWFLKENEEREGEYIVGYFGANGFSDIFHFSNKLEACAFFILKKLDFWEAMSRGRTS